LKPIDKYSQPNIKTIVCDIFNYASIRDEVDDFIGEDKKFDLVLSDIAPNTTGRKDVDQYASVELNIEIVKFASEFLKD
jgi:23S rRNA U2552 (ribose-2'-O)-methylase RlmE/FtsJ